MHRFFIPLASVLFLAFAACGGDDGSPAPPGPASTPTAAASPADTPAATPEATPSAAPATATPAAAVTATPTPAVAGTTPISHSATTTPPPATQPPPPIPATATPTQSTASNPASATVGVTGSARYFWSPAKVAIAPGGSVTWAWSGDGFHDVVIEALGYSSGGPVKEGSYTVTFPAAGSFSVVCSVHPDTMRGTVTVE